MVEKLLFGFRLNLPHLNKEVYAMTVLKRIGRSSPGALVTAAFIGPGTITTCIRAGYTQSYSLLSIMITATLLAIVIQYYAAKIGIITQCGISKNIQLTVKSKIGRSVAYLMIICAIFVGNCAFEAGNITGAALGWQVLFQSPSSKVYVVGTTVIAGMLLWKGHFSFIQSALKLIVLLMAVCFAAAMIIVRPDLSNIISGLFSLDFNDNVILIGALIGTTVGPYSIFLHSEAAAQLWHDSSDIKDMMIDTIVSIAIGGIISCCIIVVAAGTASVLEIQDLTIMNFSKSLELPLGLIGQKIFLIGLFAAGISSAITAPLAAAYTITGLCSEKSIISKKGLFHLVWGTVLLFGFIVSLFWGSSPTNLILFVQYVNALVLPLVIMFLLYCLNSHNMGKHKNGLLSNIVLCTTVAICILFAFKNFL